MSSSPGVVGDGVTDDTAALQAVLNAAQGKRLIFDVAATYKIGRLTFPSNCVVVLSADVKFVKKANAGGTFYLSNISNTKIYAYGAQIDGHDAPGNSTYAHTVYVLGTTNCEIHDLFVDGSSMVGEKDALYIGKGTGSNENLIIKGGGYNNAARNNISVVAGHNTRIEDLTVNGALLQPGCGIDVEANFYGAVSGTKITRVTANGNVNAGILTSFGMGTVIDDCDAHNNAHYGFCSTSGSGQVFADGVYRPNVDIVAVTGFVTSTGEVQTSAQPPVGTPVYVEVRNGATRPTEIPSACLIVSRHVGSTGVVLGRSVGHSEFVSLSNADTGTLTSDPATSDIRLLCLVDGQSDGGIVKNSRATGNGEHAIVAVTCGQFEISNCEVSDSGQANIAIANARGVTIANTTITGGSKQGISVNGGSGTLAITGCTVTNTGGKGISVTEWTGAVIDGNTVTNCAASEPSSAKAGVHLTQLLSPTVTNNIVTQDAGNTTTLYGIWAEASATGGTFTGNNLTGAGTTNANALIVPAGSVKSGNIGRDGLPIA